MYVTSYTITVYIQFTSPSLYSMFKYFKAFCVPQTSPKAADEVYADYNLAHMTFISEETENITPFLRSMHSKNDGEIR